MRVGFINAPIDDDNVTIIDQCAMCNVSCLRRVRRVCVTLQNNKNYVTPIH